MRESPLIKELPQLRDVSPLEAVARWPHDRRLMMLHSGRVHPRWSRWSILAEPALTWRFGAQSHWKDLPKNLPPWARGVRITHEPLTDLDSILNATRIRTCQSTGELPFAGGWIGCFSYDLGRVIEPRATSAAKKPPSGWPLIELAWCPDTLVFDHVQNVWHGVGDCDSIAAHLIDRSNEECGGEFALGPVNATVAAGEYQTLVSRAIEYIRAGDIFQANIAQKFTAEFAGSARSLAVAAMRRSQPWYGALLELDAQRAIVSLSPELFLQVDPITRVVTTRPIKGTRPASVNARELLESSKDAAELHMIVDLMRNDLGRVCEFGSVRLPHPRLIESHPTVHHGVGEVRGTLREGTTVGDILRATFPGGSVTGAPKIRAMQIIDELEREDRGPYCGAIGLISDCGAMTLNIAIRTMLLRDGVMDYRAGAGIVADSDPSKEHQECLAKTAVLESLIMQQGMVHPRDVHWGECVK